VEYPLIQSLKEMSTRDMVVALIDVLIVAFLIYRILMLVRGTRGWRILLGVLVFTVALVVSDTLHLTTLHWILEKATLLGPVALVILFLPELRQALEGLTRFGFLADAVKDVGHEQNLDRASVEEIVGAVAEMSKDKVGAIIVIETGSHLDEVAATGVTLNAKITTSLLGSIFFGQNPLHDGAVIIRGDHVFAAACRLPLSENQRIDRRMHMRHRAAVGVTESNDVISIVVSEERGTISVAQEGRITPMATTTDLREFLIKNTVEQVEPDEPPKKRRRDRSKKEEESV
jgi:diadenylate cyclase